MPDSHSEMWSYRNPVDIRFGVNAIAGMAEQIGNARYALVTYGAPFFRDIAKRLSAEVGPARCVIDDVQPNPDCGALAAQCAQLWSRNGGVDVIVAIGGGSVIDTAQVLAAASDGFDTVMDYIRTGAGADSLSLTPLIAVPTTAGTGSEVTSWATVWDEEAGEKYSLSHSRLYPRVAIVDPSIMLGKSIELTLATGLDALSHALESIWNKNANPVSTRHAVFAARTILRDLPKLLAAPTDLALRTSLAEAALTSGLAFSNTKTAIAHNLSYPVTLRYGVTHGIACSFTLPTILRSVSDIDGFRGEALREIFGADLIAGADMLAERMRDMNVDLRFRDYGADPVAASEIIDAAFLGQRGRNFLGRREDFLLVAQSDGLIS
ncbi:MAG: phosphonoacetaldehyde reductase [Alphaproteobacteria bacterium]